jgi:membrane protease YdiL (CAAX protease family)
MMGKPISDFGVLAWLAVSIVWMRLVFDADFGDIYQSIVVATLAFYLLDIFTNLFKYGVISLKKIVSFPVERDTSTRWLELFIGIAGYAVFLVATSLVTQVFSPQSLPTTNSLVDIISQMSTDIYQATTPILAGSVILMVIGWGLMIPIAETLLFNGKVFEALYDMVKKKSFLAILMICLIIGAGAAMYHLSSKSGNSVSLMITFMFFTICAFMVWWRKSLMAAIFCHMCANLIAVGWPLLATVSLTSLILPAAGIGGAILLINVLKKQGVLA